MSYVVSVIPKKATTTNSTRLRKERFEAKKLPVVRKLFKPKRVTQISSVEGTVAYKTRPEALVAAAKIRNHVHGVTAKVFPASEYTSF